MSSSDHGSSFRPTRWTLVLQAQAATPEAKIALSELCEAYYLPVLRFLSRENRSEDEARELAHEFFARVLRRADLNADPQRGRFRSYLLGSVKHFLADQRKHARRQKRGGDARPESLEARCEDPASEEPGDPQSEVSDTFFDRQWALAVMERSLSRVRREFLEAGKGDQFERLKPWLVGGQGGLSQAETAAAMGWSETAVKVAIHRLRKRVRQTVREEIAQTVASGTDIDEELRYLIQTLAEQSG